MRSRFVLLLLVIAVTVSAAAQNAQDTGKGFAADKTYDFSNVDSISIFNGNLTVPIPIGRRYVVSSTLSYQFFLTYNGNVWDHTTLGTSRKKRDGNDTLQEVTVEHAFLRRRESNAGVGWMLSLGWWRTGDVPAYVTPDGSSHSFRQRRLPNKLMLADGRTYTDDGSYLRLTPSGGVEHPNGTIHEFDTKGRLVSMRDRFGASVTIRYEPGLDLAEDWIISDGQREHFVDMVRVRRPEIAVDYDEGGTEEDVIDVVKKVQFSTTAPLPSTEYTFTYQGGDDTTTVPLSRQLANEQDCDRSPIAYAAVLASVQLPDGSTYQMTTDRGDTTTTPPSFAELDPPADGAIIQCAQFLGINDSTDKPKWEEWGVTQDTLYLKTVQSPSGHLTALKLPTGGTIHWEYQKYHFPRKEKYTDSCPPGSDAASCQLAISGGWSIGVSERREMSGADTLARKTYTKEPVSDTTQTNAFKRVTTYGPGIAEAWSEELSYSVNYFAHGKVNGQYGMPFTVRPYTQSATQAPNPDPTSPQRFLSSMTVAGGKLARYNYVQYEGDPRTEDDGDMTNRRLKTERAVELDGNGNIVKDVITENSDFDGFGHYRKVETYDRLDPSVTQTTETRYNKPDADSDPGMFDSGTYEPGTAPPPFHMLPTDAPWVLNRYSSVIVRNADTAVKTLHTFSEDGLPTRKRTLRLVQNAAATVFPLDEHDLLAAFTYSAAGDLATERYFGGDAQTLDEVEPLSLTPLPATSVKLVHTYERGALKTSAYDPSAGFFSANNSYDPKTGLLSSSTDPAGLTTAFTYDSSERLKTAAPAGAGVTQYTYKARSLTSPAEVTVMQKDSSAAATTLSELQFEFDLFGRVSKELRKTPAGTFTSRITSYDERGLVKSKTEWSSARAITYKYDALGRVVEVKGPDFAENSSAVTSFAYTGSQKTARTTNVATTPDGQEAATTTETFDAFGRLVEVSEPAGATTTYKYDIGGRLREVNMTAAGISQRRKFNYDGRGFLTSEEHPESGITWYEYDARGKVLKRGTPTATIGFAYDGAERLLRVYEIAGVSELDLKRYTYDTAGQGRLATAVRHNRHAPGGDVRITESYAYDGAGRIGSRTTSASTGESFTETYGYDDAGQPTSIEYPTCTGCPVRTIENVYKFGLLSQVKGYTPASGITYHSSGMVKDVKHLAADGINTGAIWTQAIGVEAMARPSEISVTGHCPSSSLSASLTAKEITTGEPAALTVAAIGAQTFQWYERTASGDVLLTGQTTNTLGLTLDSSRSFWVRVGNGVCTFDSNVVLVTVKAVQCPPISVTIDAPPSVAPGVTAMASVQEGFTSYAWSISGSGSSIVSGQGSHEVTFKAGCSDPVSLQVIVSSSCATSPPTRADVSVIGGATATVSGSTTVNQGPGTVDVTVALTGTAPWTLVWSDGAQQTATVSPHKRAVPKDETRMYSLSSVVDGNGCTGTKSGSATITVKPPAPTQASAAAASATSIRVTWSHSGSTDTVDSFQLERRGPDGTNFFIAAASARELTQTVAADAAYVYRVRAFKGPTFSDFSSADLATAVIFADDPLLPGQTKVRAVHLTELRTAVAAVRALTTSTTPVFTDATPVLVRKAHIEELRTMLNQALAALALPLWTFTDDPFAADQKIKAVHFDELRGGVR